MNTFIFMCIINKCDSFLIVWLRLFKYQTSFQVKFTHSNETRKENKNKGHKLFTRKFMHFRVFSKILSNV